jgi:hypothetical protein
MDNQTIAQVVADWLAPALKAEMSQRCAWAEQEAQRDSLRLVLYERFGTMPPTLEGQVARADLPTLTTLLDCAATAGSIDKLCASLSEPGATGPLHEWMDMHLATALKVGDIMGRRESVRRVVRSRFGVVPAPLEQRIAGADHPALIALLRRAATAASVDEV